MGKKFLLAWTLLAAFRAYGSAEITCYRAAYDADGDGYAAQGSPEAKVRVDSHKKLRCPSGYVRMAGDCDDRNAAVHPYRAEVAYDGVDNDCAGGVDEAEPVYADGGHGNTTTGFGYQFRVNSSVARSATTQLYSEVEWAALSQSTLIKRLPKVRTAIPVRGTLTGLNPGMAYRMRVRLYRRTAEGTYESIGVPSDWYYSATQGTNDLGRARTALVLKALKQVSEADEGRVGYRGTSKVDGTRYGASAGEAWCSEFYSWASAPFLKGVAGKSTVDALVAYFRGYGRYHNSLTGGQLGDYLALDSDGDGKKNHSGMVFAREGTEVWTIEGNAGNRVGVRRRPPSYVVGIGRIGQSQLK